MNNEEQIRILQMVADGILSAEEGEGLLDALDDTEIADAKPVDERNDAGNSERKWLRFHFPVRTVWRRGRS